jgi:hypothetical protein
LQGLAPDAYYLKELPLSPYWTQIGTGGMCGGAHTVALGSGQAIGGINFGNWLTGDYQFDRIIDIAEVNLMWAAMGSAVPPTR